MERPGIFRVEELTLLMSDMVDPGPTRTFVLSDMRDDSIDVGNFAPDKTGWQDAPG